MEQNCNCLFCKDFLEIVSKQKRLAWTTLCRLAFLSIKKPETNEFIHVRDLFNFFNEHWSAISHFDQLKKKTWKKSILDALNHSDFFQSGINQFHTNGYWKLTDSTLPNIKNRRSKKIEEKGSKKEIKSTNPTCDKIPKHVFVNKENEDPKRKLKSLNPSSNTSNFQPSKPIDEPIDKNDVYAKMEHERLFLKNESEKKPSVNPFYPQNENERFYRNEPNGYGHYYDYNYPYYRDYPYYDRHHPPSNHY